MEEKRKWTSWIWGAGILAIVMTVLGVYTFSSAGPRQNGQPAQTANASVIGYGGPVLVRLSLDERGKIAALDIGGARFAETQGIGSRVLEENFAQSFIGLTPPLTLGEQVDGIAGATVSSRAVVGAINEAAAFLQQNSTFDNN